MSDEKEQFEVLYFGCRGQAGHHLWRKDPAGNIVGAYYGLHPDFIQRFGPSGERLDGMFCPETKCSPQIWMGSKVGPWVIVSWWDYSVDSRPGSHSTFITRHGTPEELFDRAKQAFEEVFARQPEVKRGLHIWA